MGLFKSLGKAVGDLVSSTPVGGLFDSFSGRYQQDDANKMAMQAWNLANDYNHPKAQVERLVSSGLNPYLVNISGNTAGTPGLTGGNVQTGVQSIFSGLNNVMGALQGQANLQNTRAQTQASTAAAGASTAMTQLNETKAENQSIINSLTRDTMIADLDYKRQQTELARAQTSKTSAEADIAQGEADIFGFVGGAKGAGTLGKGAGTLGKGAIKGFGKKGVLRKGLQIARSLLKK